MCAIEPRPWEVWYNGGCWRVGHTIDGDSFDWRRMTEAEAIAVRDALNRLSRDTPSPGEMK